MQRRLRALELVEQRERKSLEIGLLKERRIEERERQEGSRALQEPVRAYTDEFNEGGVEAAGAARKPSAARAQPKAARESAASHTGVCRAQSRVARCVSGGYTSCVKDSGLRIRIERELREKFLATCRKQDRPAARVLREFTRMNVAANHNASFTAKEGRKSK